MKLLIAIISILFAKTIFAQADSVITTVDSIVPEKSTLTLGTVYANNASYYGQRSATPTPYLAVAAAWRLKSGFYFSGSTYKLLQEKTGSVSAVTVGLGYSFKLAPKLSAELGYSYSFYPDYSPLLQAGNAGIANVGLSYNTWITATLAADLAFGEVNDAFVTAALSKSISLFSISRKDVITLAPVVELAGGTQHFYQAYVTQQKLRDSLLGSILSPITGESNPGSETTTVRKTSFDLLSYTLKVPLAYNRSRYQLELAYQLSHLGKAAQTGAGDTNSFLTASFYYQF